MKHLSSALCRTTAPPLLCALLATALPTLSWAQAPEEEARQGLDCESYSQVRTTLDERPRDDTRLRSAAQAKLKSANHAFAQYRQALCSLLTASLGGAAGNAREIRRLRCVTQLNDQHVAYLAAISR